jgi:hypothetical protein
MRQAVYGTARLGIYFTLEDYFKEKNGGNMSTVEKVGSSLFAGALGSLIGNPFDLALVIIDV